MAMEPSEQGRNQRRFARRVSRMKLLARGSRGSSRGTSRRSCVEHSLEGSLKTQSRNGAESGFTRISADPSNQQRRLTRTKELLLDASVSLGHGQGGVDGFAAEAQHVRPKNGRSPFGIHLWIEAMDSHTNAINDAIGCHCRPKAPQPCVGGSE